MNPIKYIILFSGLVLLSCTDGKTEASLPVIETEHPENIQLTKVQFESANMEVGRLSEKPFAQIVSTNGIIEVPPQNRAVISAFSGGYIKHTSLLIGDKVKKGQRLVTMENPAFITMQQNYLETAEQLVYLKSEYDRQKTMLEENITSQKSFLKAESDYKTAKARNTSLKKNLQMLNINPEAVLQGEITSQASIYSPIDGFVTEIFVNTGTYVSPADKIMEIMDTDHIHLELKIFEKDLLQLRKGQEILFQVPEASQEVFKGEVHLVGTAIDPKSRIAMIHGHIAEKDEANFTAGMFVEANIVTAISNWAALPEDAVVEHEGRSYALMIEDETDEGFEIHPIEVRVGKTYQGFTAIKNTSEIAPQSRFITKGGFVLLKEEGGGHSH